MHFALSPHAERAGYDLVSFETVGSTNAEAIAAAREGRSGPTWFVSSHQQAGRGRRGRAWATPEGNLAASLLVTGRDDLASVATLGFVAGLALSAALEAVLPNGGVTLGLDGIDGRGPSGSPARIELKWPNDVLAHGAKLAGILLESTLLADRRFAVAIGIGVNVVSHPPDLPYPATSLSALGARADAAALFAALSDSWVGAHAMWAGGRGLSAVREAWLKKAAGLGQDVAVRVDGSVVRGRFETIDEQCRFVIRKDDGGLTHISAGDVHFGAVASAAAV